MKYYSVNYGKIIISTGKYNKIENMYGLYEVDGKSKYMPIDRFGRQKWGDDHNFKIFVTMLDLRERRFSSQVKKFAEYHEITQKEAMLYAICS